MWYGWEGWEKRDLPGRLQLQWGFPGSEIKPELFCLKSFLFVTCNWKLIAKYIQTTQTKYSVFLNWSIHLISFIFSSPVVIMDSPSLKNGSFFLERYAPAEAIWSVYVFYRKSDLVCFRQNWFLLPLLPYTRPAPSACYFLVWPTENVFFGDICDATENSVSLPQSPSSGNFLPWAIGHIVQPWLQGNLNHGSEQEAALKSRPKLSRASFYQARL